MKRKKLYNIGILFFFVLPVFLSLTGHAETDTVLDENAVKNEYVNSSAKPQQIAAFTGKEKARTFAEKLQKDGKEAYVLKAKTANKKTVYKVYVKESGKKVGVKGGGPLSDWNGVSEAKAGIPLPENGSASMPSESGNISSKAPAQDISPDVVPTPVRMDFRDYVNSVLNANPSIKMNEQDYRQVQVRFLRDLEAYSVNVSLNGSTGLFYDGNGMTNGSNVSIDATKNLYDGGRKQILEKEFEIVRALSKTDLLNNYDTALLAAALYYSDFSYNQEALDFLKEQFELQKRFIEQVESRYQKGVKFTIYDSLTAQSEYLKLEKDLLQQKTNIVKAETAFRQYGHIYSENPIKLSPLDIRFAPEIDHLQKYALVHNKSIFAARLRDDLQRHRISEREAEGGIKIDAASSLRFQAGSTAFTGGSNVTAGISLRFALPLFDGGVRKSEIAAEQIESIKQRFGLEKTTEDIIKKVHDIHSDYTNIEKGIEILEQQLLINEKRLKVSLERLEKGLEDYRAVRESWNDLIATKITLIQHKTLSQKLLLDLLILSGKSVFN
ncbi:MAG: TolC family protein [Thermodesulfovibrionales bacterium]|jgi:outer membrane protein TolC